MKNLRMLCMIISASVMLGVCFLSAMEQGGAGPAAGVPVQRPIPTKLQQLSAKTIAREIWEGHIDAPTQDLKDFDISDGQKTLIRTELVKIFEQNWTTMQVPGSILTKPEWQRVLLARKKYLKFGHDVGERLGVNTGGFSVAELLDAERILYCPL